ncbi:MAG: aminopeptidase [Burkholderiales bacterium]|nr:aminopeptidase [Burkholderiales bacterium]
MDLSLSLHRTLPLAALSLAASLAGCGTVDAVDYYWQGAAGQFAILARAQPIDEVIGTSPDAALKRRLARVQAMRTFASRELGLPDNASYTRYADVERPFVVWNVFAAPPLSLEGRQWCFPVAGCVSYRGYFDEQGARAEAARLAKTGDDVWVAGVAAYSTLGYFDDPVLSTFVRWPEVEVARMMFHELAHQIVYVKDDSQFNESFAATVEDVGVRRWIATQDDPGLVAQYARAERLRDAFRELLRSTRHELVTLYASAASDADKRAGKATTLARMRAAYEAAKAGEPGLAGYERWFAGIDGTGPNNASIVSVGLYTAQVPAFRALLDAADGDLPRFYAAVRELAALPKAQRQAALAAARAGRSPEASGAGVWPDAGRAAEAAAMATPPVARPTSP